MAGTAGEWSRCVWVTKMCVTVSPRTASSSAAMWLGSSGPGSMIATLPRADDVAERALEGERPGIVGDDAAHAGRDLLGAAGREVEAPVVGDVVGHAGPLRCCRVPARSRCQGQALMWLTAREICKDRGNNREGTMTRVHRAVLAVRWSARMRRERRCGADLALRPDPLACRLSARRHRRHDLARYRRATSRRCSASRSSSRTAPARTARPRRRARRRQARRADPDDDPVRPHHQCVPLSQSRLRSAERRRRRSVSWRPRRSRSWRTRTSARPTSSRWWRPRRQSPTPSPTRRRASPRSSNCRSS